MTPLVPDPNPDADHDSPPRDRDSPPRDRPVLLSATPDADAVADWIRTLAVLAAVLGLLVTLIAVELLVRI